MRVIDMLPILSILSGEVPTAEACSNRERLPATSEISPNQMRKARDLLGWTAVRLAAYSGTHSVVIRDYEKRGLKPIRRSPRAPPDPMPVIRTTLESAGVEFTAEDVRLRETGE